MSAALGRAGKAFHKKLCAEYEFESAELEILRLLCEQLDIATVCSKALKSGVTTTNKRSGVEKTKPEAALLQSTTRLIAALIKQLKLPEDDTNDLMKTGGTMMQKAARADKRRAKWGEGPRSQAKKPEDND
jgi:phage terminase small subunit